MTEHKWAKELRAMADGLPIQSRFRDALGSWSYWKEASSVFLHESWEFRVKPVKKPDVEVLIALRQSTKAKDMVISEHPMYASPNVKCVFDGDTGKLLSVEVI